MFPARPMANITYLRLKVLFPFVNIKTKCFFFKESQSLSQHKSGMTLYVDCVGYLMLLDQVHNVVKTLFFLIFLIRGVSCLAT